jgi:myosin heavy subunit
MYNQTYKILAKHFAETVNVQLVFEEGAQPKTDGRTITLPTELADNAINLTLGALLHETAHIRYTDCDISRRMDLTPEEHETLNSLEDIRIDLKTIQQYPNAVDFQQRLMQDVIKRHGKDLATESKPQQILKGLIMLGHNLDPALVYSPATVELIKKFSTFVETALSKNTKETKDLVEPAKELTRLLIGEVLKQQTKQPQQNGQQQDKNQNGSGSGLSSSSGTGKDSDQQLADDYEEAEEELKEAKESLKKNQTKKTKLEQDYENKHKEYKNSRRTLRLNETQRQKLNWQKRQLEADNHPNLAKQAQERIEEKEERIKEVNQEYQENVQDLQKLKQEHSNTSQEISDAYQKQKEAENKLKAIQSKAFGKTGKTKLLGFEAIDPEALKPDEHITEIDARQTLDELIKEALILKRDHKFIDEEGSRLNNSKLADVYTDTDQLFINQETKEHKTQVAIIVDCSGSMGYYEHNESLTLALKTVKTIADALQKAISQGAPADFTIYGFGNNIVTLTPDAETYTYKELVGQVKEQRGKMGGGTNLAEAVTAITDELKQNAQDTQDRCAVIITDAQVGEEDLKELINTADTDGARFVFVAINGNIEGNPFAEKLFGDNNIKDIKDGAEVLQRALFSVM